MNTKEVLDAAVDEGLKVIARAAIHDAIVTHQERLLKANIWHSCLNCDHFDKVCQLYKQLPPPEVILHGCVSWEDVIPF